MNNKILNTLLGLGCAYVGVMTFINAYWFIADILAR